MPRAGHGAEAVVTDTCIRTNPPIGDAPGANHEHTEARRPVTHPKRCRGDEGAALVEFALISILLLTLLFGIINFGLILSFRQDVTRAAAEGARGGAVAVPLASGQSYVHGRHGGRRLRRERRREADGRSVQEHRLHHGRHDLHGPPDGAACASQPAYQCVTVKVSYDYERQPALRRPPDHVGVPPGQHRGRPRWRGSTRDRLPTPRPSRHGDARTAAPCCMLTAIALPVLLLMTAFAIDLGRQRAAPPHHAGQGRRHRPRPRPPDRRRTPANAHRLLGAAGRLRRPQQRGAGQDHRRPVGHPRRRHQEVHRLHHAASPPR